MWYVEVGVYIHNCACALVLPIYWLDFEILIVSDYCSQISHGKKKKIINFNLKAHIHPKCIALHARQI